MGVPSAFWQPSGFLLQFLAKAAGFPFQSLTLADAQ